ncbi:MAG: response regulator [Alteromonadales bacterium]|nr:response regulator [Alteromonadales bacterium]
MLSQNKYYLRLIPFFILISLTVFILWVAGKYHADFDNSLIEQSKETLMLTSHAQAEHVEVVLQDIKNDLIELSLNPALHQRVVELKKGELSTVQYNPLALSFANSRNKSGALYLLDTQGFILERAPFKSSAKGKDYSKKPGVSHVLASTKQNLGENLHSDIVYTSDVFVSGSGRNVISMCLPIFSQGEFIGLLRSIVYLDNFNVLFTHNKPRDTRFTWMMDAKGEVISHPKKELIGVSIHDVSFYRGDNAEASIDYLKAAKQPGSALFIIGELEKKEVVMAWYPVQVNDKHWAINARVDYQEVSRPSKIYAKRLYITSAILITLLLLLDLLRYHTKKEQGRLSMKAESASEASKLKSDFLANMSHEIRTPMNAIMGLTHLTLKTDLNSKQSDYLGKILSASNNLLGIINDILDFAKIEADKLELEEIDFNLREVLIEVEALLIIKAQEKGLLLSFEITSDSNIYVNGDPLRLKQVLINLTNNAIKFTHTGSVTINVRELPLPTEDLQKILLEFSVHDTGIGLSVNEMDNLFVEFSQADTSTTRKYGGSGLGLAICKKLVEYMGGKISVSSEKGVGSCFSFSCRFNVAKQVNDPVTNSLFLSNKAILKKILSNKKILVVEDNEINQEIIDEILVSEGAEVSIANNGIEAIKYFEDGKNSHSFDIVLMDLQMPEMDGYQATQFIRKHISREMLPIVAMSAHTQDENIEQCRAVGMNDYIMKPYQPEIMFTIITNNLISSS